MAEDRILAVGDAGDLEDRGRALGAGAECGEFTERALGRAVMGMNESFDNDLGMSGDFEAAILEGSTIIRIGSALFEGLGSRASSTH